MNKKIVKYIATAGVLAGLFLSTSFMYADTRLDDLANQARKRSEQSKERVEKVREDMKVKMKEGRENAQQRINQLRDQKKKESALKINNQLVRVNQVWTDHFTNVLDKLDVLLQKIESRTEKASANGKDISQVKIAIQSSAEKIAAARTAVENQAQKTYIVDTTSITQNDATSSSQSSLISKLREQFKILRNQLFSDLTSLRDGEMKDARNSVKDALQTLSQVPNVDTEPKTNTDNQ